MSLANILKAKPPAPMRANKQAMMLVVPSRSTKNSQIKAKPWSWLTDEAELSGEATSEQYTKHTSIKEVFLKESQ